MAQTAAITMTPDCSRSGTATFSYTSGDPVNATDPTGTMTEADDGGVDNSNGQGQEAALGNAYTQFVAQYDPGYTVDYNKWRSWVTQGQASGNFKDFVGGVIHGLGNLADAGSPSCWAGLACTGKTVSDTYNKVAKVNTDSLAYQGGNFTVIVVSAVAAPEADLIDTVDGVVTAGRVWRAARVAKQGDPLVEFAAKNRQSGFVSEFTTESGRKYYGLTGKGRPALCEDEMFGVAHHGGCSETDCLVQAYYDPANPNWSGRRINADDSESSDGHNGP